MGTILLLITLIGAYTVVGLLIKEYTRRTALVLLAISIVVPSLFYFTF